MRTLVFCVGFMLWNAGAFAQQPGLCFPSLPGRWDEALPLGNGKLGALVWQKDGRLRLSLDRADLWDNRRALLLEQLTFDWVRQKWAAHQYDSVQKIGDEPYDVVPYPTKIPAAGLEWNIAALGSVTSAELDTRSALVRVCWSGGAVLETFVAATQPQGCFRFIHVPAGFTPQLVMPGYHPDSIGAAGGPVEGPSLQRLRYAKGTLKRDGNAWLYRQPTSEGHVFSVRVAWVRSGDTLTGSWTVNEPLPPGSYTATLRAHRRWWANFWAACSLNLPDSVMLRQWYLDRYKLGCVARSGAPPVTLQAVWTADEGRLPPWKGDVHNDLNTQLSYWPAFSGNYREGGASFTDWLSAIRDTCTRFTRTYFGTGGLNVPGVCTLRGSAMGGWIQYALSPTTAAWLAQDFHDQWLYWPDRRFLRERAYPYLSAVATYLEAVTHSTGRLPLSSSPEIFDNSPQAWFPVNTNFDQSLMIALFHAAAREAEALGKTTEALHWREFEKRLSPLDTDATGLTIAPGTPLTESHRHMSPYMAIYPLGLLTPDKPLDKILIDRSLAHLSSLGTRSWVGYSFCWAGCLFARALQGDSAAWYLRAFATNFCSPNSFHLNGDQRGGQYAASTYRPFTLEGNFAYAAGVQEMLLQSYGGIVRIFPAIPRDWKTVSFYHLRAEGGYLVDASMRDGRLTRVVVTATTGGTLKMAVPGRPLLIKCFQAGERCQILSE